jgi:hypothetical protein
MMGSPAPADSIFYHEGNYCAVSLMTFFILQFDVPVEVFLLQVFAGENDDRLLHLLVDLLENFGTIREVSVSGFAQGSSANRGFGLFRIAWALERRCSWPPKSSRGRGPSLKQAYSTGRFRSRNSRAVRESDLSGALQMDRHFHSRSDREEGIVLKDVFPFVKRRSPARTR